MLMNQMEYYFILTQANFTLAILLKDSVELKVIVASVMGIL